MNRWGYLFAFFALYLQFMLPLGHAIAASENSDPNLPGKAIICSYFGVKYIDLSTGNDVTSPAEDLRTDCPVCLAFDLGGSTLASASFLYTAPVLIPQARMAVEQRSEYWLELPADYSSRAPPRIV